METMYKRGDQVEIICNEEGFENSYFPATIISPINTNEYIVQFNTLLGQDEQNPQREFRNTNDLRPVPPEIVMKRFALKAEVDAYANDGWWKGTVSKTCFANSGNRYHVKFERGGGEIEIGKYFVSSLRVHQDWINGNWVSSINKNFP